MFMSRQAQAARLRPRGQQQSVIRSINAARPHRSPRGVDLVHLHPRMIGDIQSLKTLGCCNQWQARIILLNEDSLGQRRALIGAMMFSAEHVERAIISGLAQPQGCRHTGFSGPYNHHAHVWPQI